MCFIFLFFSVCGGTCFVFVLISFLQCVCEGGYMRPAGHEERRTETETLTKTKLCVAPNVKYHLSLSDSDRLMLLLHIRF